MADPIELNDDQLTKLANLVTENISNNLKLSNVNSANPVDYESNVNNKHKDSTTDKSTNQFTAEDVAKAVFDRIAERDENRNNQVYETLWNEKLNSALASVPGLSDFLDGEDDYGNVRKEQLQKSGSYEDKLNALDKLKNTFKEASSGAAGRKPVVDVKAQQKAEEAKNMYEEMNQKMKKGEYTTVDEMTNDFFERFSKEAKGLV